MLSISHWGLFRYRAIADEECVWISGFDEGDGEWYWGRPEAFGQEVK